LTEGLELFSLDLVPPTILERGTGYRSIRTFRAPSVIAPLAMPGVRIAVADLVP
jgi:hypothetical protein